MQRRMKKYLLLLGSLVLAFRASAGNGLAADPITDYLKKNIEVYYLADPNRLDLDFSRINPEGVFLDTDGIIFGKTNNSGMDSSALLLSAIFKDPKGKQGGDAALQNILYQVFYIAMIFLYCF